MTHLEKARQFHKAIQMFAQTLTQEDSVVNISEMYPKWNAQRLYQAGEYVGYGETETGKTQVYQCIQGHMSQAGWTPDTEAALWKRIGYEAGVQLWVQPLGATDAYQKGDKVSHNGVVYVCIANNNVWEPGVYGWEVAAA